MHISPSYSRTWLGATSGSALLAVSSSWTVNIYHRNRWHGNNAVDKSRSRCVNTAATCVWPSSKQPAAAAWKAADIRSSRGRRSLHTSNGARIAPVRGYSRKGHGGNDLEDPEAFDCDLGDEQFTQSEISQKGVFVALGSNIGDRFDAIETACKMIDADPLIRIVATSPLYETEPMYVEDQARFLNGVCQIETDLEPMQLLDRLQAIENDLGRVKIIDKGPRNIDLDIISYDDSIVATERLVVPHLLMHEREFVLRPLCDIVGSHYFHPVTMKTTAQHLAGLPQSETPMYPATPLSSSLSSLRSLDPWRRTHIMSILNTTPDSFSDGGVHQPRNVEALRATAAAHIAAGASIIDIGGQSSRPNAADVSAEEETSRVLPAIEAILSLPESKSIAISVDTYRASVAEAAIKAGAHIINDISAGLLDEDMLPTISELGCTYVMMHMRGTPATMQNQENCSYPAGLIPTIAEELLQRLQAAQEAGIRRWRIILDPGIGFAKTVEQNLEILRMMPYLRQAEGLSTYPWLVGSSRKGFIGKVTGISDPLDRMTGTAVTVAAAVRGGAEVVRVHDVKEMVQAVRMAEAIYRR